MNNLRIIFILIFSISGINLHAVTYYVSQSGSDANVGTSPDSPWQHCPGVPGWNGNGTILPGDIVYFNNSDTWETSEGNAVIQAIGGVTYDGKNWGEGERAVLKAQGNLEGSVISILEDHGSFPTIFRGFEVDANDFVTSGIGLNYPRMQRTLLGAVKRIEDCLVHNVSSSAPGSFEYGIVISNWHGIYQVRNVEVLNCKVYNISRGGINLYPGNDVPDNWLENVTVRGNEVWNCGTDPAFGGSSIAIKNHVKNAIVEYNSIHDVAHGIGIGISTHNAQDFRGPENAIIRYNIISGSRHAGFYIQDPGDKSLEIYGNIITGSLYQGIILAEDLTGELSVKIYNNTFYNNHAGSDWSEEIQISCQNASFTSLEIKNNLFYCASSTRAIVDEYGLITDHSSNLYFRPGGGTLVVHNGTNYSASDVRNWESSAIPDDPLVINESDLPTKFVGTYGVDMRPNTDGLKISPTSPAFDSGFSLESFYQNSINSVHRPRGESWDIGAYEIRTATGTENRLNSPDRYSLHQNYPNPFNPSTIIEFYLLKAGDVKIEVYNIAGQKIQTLLNRRLPSGNHEIEFNAANLSSGVYLYRIETADFQAVRRMVLIK